jgi:hypothetical protein
MTKRNGEAPLPLILAGAAALTAILVVIGGAFTRTGNSTPSSPPETKYIQSLEGVVATYGQRGPLAQGGGSPSRTEGRGGGSTAAPRDGRSLHNRLLSSVSSPDIMIRRLGHVDGDFVYSRSRGWLRFDPSTTALQSVPWADLPTDLKSRYPREIFSDRGRGGRSSEARAGGSTGRPNPEGGRRPAGEGGRDSPGGGRWTEGGSGGLAGGSGGPGRYGGGGPGSAGGRGGRGAGNSGPSGGPGAPGSTGSSGGAAETVAVGQEVSFQTTPRLNPVLRP